MFMYLLTVIANLVLSYLFTDWLKQNSIKCVNKDKRITYFSWFLVLCPKLNVIFLFLSAFMYTFALTKGEELKKILLNGDSFKEIK